MRTRFGWMTFLLALSACAEETTDAVDTDIVETDTEPVEVDASNYEVHPGAPQTFEGTLVIGDNSLDLDFSGDLEHKVAPIVGVDFRSFRGEIERDNPFGATPPTVSLVARMIIQEQVAEAGTYDCAGEGKFGLTLELYGRSPKIPEKVFTTGRITEESGLTCTVEVSKITNERLILTIADAPLLNKDLDVVHLENISIDMVMREAAAE